MIKIRDRKIGVDILEELHQFEWRKGEIRGEKWLSCSPFRLEKNRSFAVNLSNGLYIDSGLDDEYWRKGTFQKLLAFLLGCSIKEAEDFLLEKYSPFYKNVNELQLKLNLSLPPKESLLILDKGIFDQFNYKNEYLLKDRRISEDILKKFKVGYDPKNNLSSFIWFDKNGNPINIKFRQNDNKKFFYLKDGSPIKNHIYLLHDVYESKAETIYITESEIDSLYIRSLGKGFDSVALGGSNLSSIQERLLISSPAKKLVICTDNDKQGERISSTLEQKLNGYKMIEKIKLPENIKDVNEMELEELRNILNNRSRTAFKFSL